MNNRIETVSIETDNGTVLINKSDYDPDVHQLSDEQLDDGDGKKAKKAETDDEREKLLEQARDLGLKPHPNTGIKKLNTMITDAGKPDVKMMVMAKDGKHFVVDDKGVAIAADGIAADGYDVEKDAWDAILAANEA